MHQKKVTYAGVALNKATRALIMLHGRGAGPEDILSLSSYLKLDGFALLAPQATNNTWYPASFMSPSSVNEPWLSAALKMIGEIVTDITNSGIKKENIYFLGFSQGACLSLEYVTRNATKYGGVIAFTGGLIGDKIYPENYSGNFERTPIFIGTSNPDPHVPVTRVHATTNILLDMNADVQEKVYENVGHTVSMDEIERANEILMINSSI